MKIFYLCCLIIALAGCGNSEGKITNSSEVDLGIGTFMLDLYKYEKIDTVNINGGEILIVPFHRGKNPALNNYGYAVYQTDSNALIQSELKIEGDRYSAGTVSFTDWDKDGKDEIIHLLEHPVSSMPGESFVTYKRIYKLRSADQKYKLIFQTIVDERTCLNGKSFGKNIRSEIKFLSEAGVSEKKLTYEFPCENFSRGLDKIKGEKFLEVSELCYSWNHKLDKYELIKDR